MKKFLEENKKALIFIFSAIFIWRALLTISQIIGATFIRQREGFIGSIPWANFDGVHYLSIADHGYFQYEQAFFPAFPLLIRFFSEVFLHNYLLTALIIVYVSLFIWIFLLYKFVSLSFNENTTRWTILFYLFFPTAFFFGAIYTESLFLCLVLGCLLAIKKHKWFLGSILAGLAGGTKLIGVFLLIPLIYEYIRYYGKDVFSIKFFLKGLLISLVGVSGLLAYMGYLWRFYQDPLFFIHAQPAFGANRTGGSIILLPQVIYRYVKIFLTVPFTNYDFWISILEMISLLLFLVILYLCYRKKKVQLSYLLFAAASIIGPTLTGTLSSLPRYVLVSFPVFIYFGSLKNDLLKYTLFGIFSILLFILTAYFLQGYFIA